MAVILGSSRSTGHCFRRHGQPLSDPGPVLAAVRHASQDEHGVSHRWIVLAELPRVVPQDQPENKTAHASRIHEKSWSTQNLGACLILRSTNQPTHPREPNRGQGEIGTNSQISRSRLSLLPAVRLVVHCREVYRVRQLALFLGRHRPSRAQANGRSSYRRMVRSTRQPSTADPIPENQS